MISTLSISSKLKYLNASNLVYHRKIRVPVFLSEQLASPECWSLCKCTKSTLAKSWILTVINASSMED